MPLPADYLERVYAGVLGKVIGVYVGRPFEDWIDYERMMEGVGEIWYYVHEKLGKPLIVTDDDISGTFTFLRAFPDYGELVHAQGESGKDVYGQGYPVPTPAQIGQTWLNYLIEKRTVLWWGGMGNSTEHTAYLRLKNDIQAPHSGSIATNSKVVAEQIGAQIFIDGWAMVAPGDPEFAVDLARRAASVSHDGEAIYGAQVLAAMEAQAFVESDINTLIDLGVSFIPKDSVVYRMINQIREWHAKDKDWRVTRERLADRYGYEKYGGGCHIVPNHGLIIQSLLYGDDDFQKTLMIVNTCGWDTDCNSGNVGCLMGIKNGLAGIDGGPDWRGPVADRFYMPTADGGRAITEAVTESINIVNIGRAMAGKEPIAPKNGSRFHFELPGSVQGFVPEDSPESKGTVWVENVIGHSNLGRRSLAVNYHHVTIGRPARVATATFIPQEAKDMSGYGLMASPTLYAGQKVRVRVCADSHNQMTVDCSLYVRIYGADDELVQILGPSAELSPDVAQEYEWIIEDTGGYPIAEFGMEIRSAQRADGTVYVDYVTWDGEPDLVLSRPAQGGTMWQRAWVDGVDTYVSSSEPYRLVQNKGKGLVIQGTREWANYRVDADVRPHMVKSAGIAARVQGMRRYYALLLGNDGTARLVKALDGDTVLAEAEFPWAFGQVHNLSLEVVGTRLRAWIDGQQLFELEDADRPLAGGAVALVCEEGRTATQTVTVRPAT